jgi:hypothetical protein
MFNQDFAPLLILTHLDEEDCKCDKSMAGKFDKYLTYITINF